MTETTARGDINIRASRYFLAHTQGGCPHCGASTPLLALALPGGHETLEPDDARADPAPGDTWSTAERGAFLFHVEYLSAPVRRLLQAMPTYRLAAGAPPDGNWANHCERCDAPLDDQELFCEPDGAFLPTTEAGAAAIHLSVVDDALEAVAAGYAGDPLYFDAMVRG